MSVNKQLDNPFDRAEKLRILEAEISLNANMLNNVSIIMTEEDRLNEQSSIESTVSWYADELTRIKLELIERIDALEMSFIKLELIDDDEDL